MKRKSFHLSLYIIIPLIFWGLSVFSIIVAVGLVDFFQKSGMDPDNAVLFWGWILGALAAGCALVVVHVLLKPVRNFVESAKLLPAITNSSNTTEEKSGGDEIVNFTRLFNQVTDALSRIDARNFFPEIVGESRAMREVLSQVLKVAASDSTVLIQGESGTGKELIATAIYSRSRRKGKPFVKLNCAAIPEGLLESELFGHEKGAFTGALEAKPGKFELADQGVIFLDEIGDMPLATQAKILRVLQEQEFERVGGTRSIKVNVRFVAATNRDLVKMSSEGRFREDLYYRLNVFSIRLPPLRERKDDILFLVEQFLKDAPQKMTISPQAFQLLFNYSWPGNIRELKNAIERAMIMAGGGTIEPSGFPPGILEESPGVGVPFPPSGTNLDEALAGYEKELIIGALHQARGVQVRAAELLGIKERSLWHRIKKYEIDVGAIKDKKE
ncbi:MAG: sigma-54 dependent transcriptional regulator [Pseudomonadota bacterium]